MGLLDKLFGPPDRDRFARLMLDALRQAGEKADLRYDPAEFRLVADDPDGGHLNLANAYAEYSAAPRSQRAAVLRRFVRGWFSKHKETPAEFTDARPDLLPVLRDRAYFELLPLQLKIDNDASLAWPHRVVADHLGLGVAYDLPEAMQMVTEDRLAEWQVSFDDALNVAIGNLTEITRCGLTRSGPGLWVSPWRDNYDAARLALPDFICRHKVRGDPVAMVPNRDTLLLTGTEDAGGLERMIALAEEALDGPRPLSALALRLQGDQWQPFLPLIDSPLRQRFELAWVKSLGHSYGEQKELLDRLHAKAGKDVFVANFSAIQHKESGRVQSYCVWTEGVDSLLPRTDLVLFFRPNATGEGGDIVARAGWDHVRRIVGDLMEPTGLYPERYRVVGFPTDEQLQAIGLEE